jgi:hypothetical protein
MNNFSNLIQFGYHYRYARKHQNMSSKCQYKKTVKTATTYSTHCQSDLYTLSCYRLSSLGRDIRVGRGICGDGFGFSVGSIVQVVDPGSFIFGILQADIHSLFTCKYVFVNVNAVKARLTRSPLVNQHQAPIKLKERTVCHWPHAAVPTRVCVTALGGTEYQ